MLDRSAAWLVEIDDAIINIRAYTAGFDRARFLNDKIVQDAVLMRLIVIGESARLLDGAARAEAPEIDWGKVAAFRNRAAHGYRSIDFAIVWGIVTHELEPLAGAVRRMLAARGEAMP